MTDQNQKKQDEGKSNDNTVAAAVTGAVVGAGMAVAGILALKNKKNRDKVKKVFTNVKDQAVDYVENIQKQAQNTKDEAQEKLVEAKEKLKEATGLLKDAKKTKQKK